MKDDIIHFDTLAELDEYIETLPAEQKLSENVWGVICDRLYQLRRSKQFLHFEPEQIDSGELFFAYGKSSDFLIIEDDDSILYKIKIGKIPKKDYHVANLPLLRVHDNKKVKAWNLKVRRIYVDGSDKNKTISGGGELEFTKN